MFKVGDLVKSFYSPDYYGIITKVDKPLVGVIVALSESNYNYQNYSVFWFDGLRNFPVDGYNKEQLIKVTNV